MTNRSGADFEIALEKWLLERGVDARRLRLHGKHDHGDLQVVDADGDRWTVECKKRNYQPAQPEIDRWVREAKTEAANARTPYWALIVKRYRSRDVGQAYVYLPASWASWDLGPWLAVSTVEQWLNDFLSGSEGLRKDVA